MADTPDAEETDVKKPSKLPLLLGLVLALAGGGGGFFAMYSGMLGGGADMAEMKESEKSDDPEMPVAKGGGEVAFVPIDPLVVTLDQANGTHLRFRAQLEVNQSAQAEVTHLLPRVVDVLNGYLRAIEMSDLSDPSALMRLRAQMLRRVQVVAGGSQVRDLLIMEFVVN